MKKLILIVLGLFLLSSPLSAQSIFKADSKIKVVSVIAANNVTPIVIKSTTGTVYSIDGFNNGTTLAYIKLYNASSATCGVGTPYVRYLIPFGSSSSGGGFNISNINGDAFGDGIVMCITTGIADNDATAPAANAYIVNIHYY
jgi:hypothetical protein